MSIFSRLGLAAVACAAIATPAAAAYVQPVSVTASDTFGNYNVNNLINGSGLNNGLHDTHWGNMWMSDWDLDQHWLLFDLGSNVGLQVANIWQYAADFGVPYYETDRGARDITVSISTDGVNFTQIAAAELDRATVTALPAQTVALSGTARYVRLDLLNNWGNPSWTGLSEVSFIGSVPEPASWGLMILGFGAIGVAARRRAAVAA